MATLWQQQDGGYVLLWKRYDNNKMADMCYYGNVMTTTRWRICVTMETLWQQQDGGYVLLWKRYDNNKMADMCYYGNVMTTTRWRICVTMETLWQQAQYIDWTCYRCILHLQQYSRRLNLFVNFLNNFTDSITWRPVCFLSASRMQVAVCVTEERHKQMMEKYKKHRSCLIFLS